MCQMFAKCFRKCLHVSAKYLATFEKMSTYLALFEKTSTYLATFEKMSTYLATFCLVQKGHFPGYSMDKFATKRQTPKAC